MLAVATEYVRQVTYKLNEDEIRQAVASHLNVHESQVTIDGNVGGGVFLVVNEPDERSPADAGP